MRIPSRKFTLWLAALALLPFPAFADTPTFENISAGDYDKIVKELSSNFAYSSVTPASSLGSVWGVEFGAVAGVTKTPEILALVKRTNANFKEDKFPHAAGLLRVGAPFGLAAEAMILPEIKVSDLKLKQYSGALQWTITDVFFTDLPVNVAVKGYLSKTGLKYSQQVPVSGVPGARVDATIDYDNTVMGAQLMVSKKLLVFEPYLALGYAKANGELNVTGAGTVNATIFTSGARSAQSKPSSAQFLAGLDIRLFFLTLGAEYQRSFGTSGFNGRLSFRF